MFLPGDTICEYVRYPVLFKDKKEKINNTYDSNMYQRNIRKITIGRILTSPIQQAKLAYNYLVHYSKDKLN